MLGFFAQNKSKKVRKIKFKLIIITAIFLAKVKPEVAVISAGEDNKYGHPTKETLLRLQTAGAEIYRTDENGTVVIETDGKTYDVVVQKSRYDLFSYTKYIGDKSGKYHCYDCQYAPNIGNAFYNADHAQEKGYEPCAVCKPE